MSVFWSEFTEMCVWLQSLHTQSVHINNAGFPDFELKDFLVPKSEGNDGLSVIPICIYKEKLLNLPLSI